MTFEPDDQRVVVTTQPIIPPYAQQGIIKTDNPRLYARPFRIDDLSPLHELRTQIEVMQFTSVGMIDADLSATRTWMGRFMDLEEELESTPTKDLAQKIQKTSSSPNSFNFVIVYVESSTTQAIAIDDNDSTKSLAAHKVIGAGGCRGLGIDAEVGYMIRKEYWGKGLATSFLRAFLAAWWSLDRKITRVPLTTSLHELLTKKRGFAIADTNEKANSPVTIQEYIRAVVVTTNTGSRRVLEKCGFRHVWDEDIEERGEQVTLAEYMLFKP